MFLNNKPVFRLSKVNDLKLEPKIPVDRSKYGSHMINRSTLKFNMNNQKVEIFFRNYSAFEDYCGNDYAVNKTCETCGRLYYNQPMLGIPIKVTNTLVDGCRKMVFHMDGVFHSFECAKLALQHIMRNSITSVDMNPIYSQSEELLSYIFGMCFPDERLDCVKPVCEFRTLQMEKLPNVLMMPVKISETVPIE